MEEINLHFRGPFTFTVGERSLFHCPLAGVACVYLWTVKSELDERYWIHYVGETRSFAKRHREHLIHILGLNYGIFDPALAHRGILLPRIYGGLWRDRTSDGPAIQLAMYGRVTADVLRYVNCLSVFVAATTVSGRLRKHIEGSIGWNLRNHHPQHKVLYPDDNHVGTPVEKQGLVLVVSADQPIAGLDDRLEI